MKMTVTMTLIRTAISKKKVTDAGKYVGKEEFMYYFLECNSIVVIGNDMISLKPQKRTAI